MPRRHLNRPVRHAPRVALAGTFDVDNLGDLLFPLIAVRELAARLPGCSVSVLAPFASPLRSFTGAIAPTALGAWSAPRAHELAAAHDAFVVGGGELLHLNDPLLGPVYGRTPEELRVCQPSRWFVEGPGSAHSRRCPTMWHGLGVPTELTPEQGSWIAESRRISPYTTVRDHRSRQRLEAVGVSDVQVVPDSAVLLDRLYSPEELERRWADVRRRLAAGERRPGGTRVVMQGCDLLVDYAPALAAALRTSPDHSAAPVTLIETGPCRRDDLFADAMAAHLDPLPHRLRGPLHLADVLATIRAADLFIGSSLHGAIAALVYGVPFVHLDLAGESKIPAFHEMAGIDGRRVTSADDLRSALEAPRPEPVPRPTVERLQGEVDTHFDRLADLCAGAPAGALSAGRGRRLGGRRGLAVRRALRRGRPGP